MVDGHFTRRLVTYDWRPPLSIVRCNDDGDESDIRLLSILLPNLCI